MATKTTSETKKTTTSSAKATAPKATVKTTATVKSTPKTATKTTKKTAVAPKPTQKKKILFVASEATPFIQTGGLAEVIGSLSKALAVNDNLDVRVVLPLYSDIKKSERDKFSYIGNIYVHLAWRNQYCGIFE